MRVVERVFLLYVEQLVRLTSSGIWHTRRNSLHEHLFFLLDLPAPFKRDCADRGVIRGHKYEIPLTTIIFLFIPQERIYFDETTAVYASFLNFDLVVFNFELQYSVWVTDLNLEFFTPLKSCSYSLSSCILNVSISGHLFFSKCDEADRVQTIAVYF